MTQLTPHKKDLLKQFVDYKCERCNLQFENKHDNKGLQIHRIKRGINNGKYELRNIIVLCKECHKLMHSNEFKQCKSR